MKTLQMLVLFAAVACAVGCGDSASEGWDANAGVAGDVSDDTFTAYGDVEPDESPPDVSADTADKDILTAAEACAPYLGTWDCECTEGSCDIGSHAFILVELLQANGNGTWTLFSTEIDGSNKGPLTCDPLHMPPTDSIYVTFEITSSGHAKWTLQNTNMDVWYILQCTPYN